EIGGIIEKFSAWIKKADETGALQDFFSNASHALHEIFETVKNLASFFGSVFKAMAGEGGDALGGISDATAKLAAWAESDEGQKQMREFFQALKDVAGAIIDVVRWVIQFSGDVGDAKDKVKGWVDAV